MSKSKMAGILLLAALCLSEAGASAQRTAKGEPFLSVGWSTPVTGALSHGGYVDYGRYGQDWYWKAGVSLQDYLYSGELAAADAQGELVLMPGSEGVFDYTHFTAYGDFMYRLVGTYSRRLNLYAGGGVFAGFCDYEMFSALPEENGGCGLKAEFIYGIRPEVELEVFILRKAALTLGVSLPVTPGTSFQSVYGPGLLHLTGSAGIRVNF